jgi:hypothetical protein
MSAPANSNSNNANSSRNGNKTTNTTRRRRRRLLLPFCSRDAAALAIDDLKTLPDRLSAKFGDQLHTHDVDAAALPARRSSSNSHNRMQCPKPWWWNNKVLLLWFQWRR